MIYGAPTGYYFEVNVDRGQTEKSDDDQNEESYGNLKESRTNTAKPSDNKVSYIYENGEKLALSDIDFSQSK